MTQVYLALYKGRKRGKTPREQWQRLMDWAVRWATNGQYSHCEIAVALDGGQFECYSSSIRDGGVRCKTMPLPTAKWDLIALPERESLSAALQLVWLQTQGRRYDLPGALGVVFKTRQRHERWFCSEWCGQVLGLSEPWRFSPNDLAVIARSLTPTKKAA